MGNVSTVDVRDMVCAQALAVVARALEAAPADGVLEILFNADDVQHDLMTWAKERGLTIHEERAMRLRFSQ